MIEMSLAAFAIAAWAAYMLILTRPGARTIRRQELAIIRFSARMREMLSGFRSLRQAIVTSARRMEELERAFGQASKSPHYAGRAADIDVSRFCGIPVYVDERLPDDTIYLVTPEEREEDE